MTCAEISKRNYEKMLAQGILSKTGIEDILNKFKQNNLKIENIPDDLLNYPIPITQKLSRLDLRIVSGDPSWEGLAVGFPGSKEDLSTGNISTPYIREILYPILDLYERLKKKRMTRMPCLYLVGARFSDVLLRKFRLLNTLIPHVIILTEDLLGCFDKPLQKSSQRPEDRIQSSLCEEMKSQEGLIVPTDKGSIRLGYLGYEVPTYEGTLNPERLDILGYDKEDGSLVAFEIKGKCGRTQLENLFLQGMEHRNWLEENKMAVKFMLGGSRGKDINTKKRVRLVLGFCDNNTPDLFHRLKERFETDPYLKVSFYSCREQ